ncbi:STAS domain-containing protein [Pseudonocardia sp. ICBG1293]|uniref:STAS domain-containing protein n=1 Tax=Pseudonocardia sp. ICBG1293 TaxID=2844382 RepID=UPI001CCF4F98|nr:STAS domain-containing protein [Pseudonocardia sp. ICBG1293]
MTDSRPPAAGTTDGTGGVSSEVTDSCDGLRLETSRPSDGVVVVAVAGELDMLTAPELRGSVAEQMSAASLVVLDLDGVRFLGTSGLAALIELREQAHRDGVELRLACTERRVLRPIGIAGLHHLFDIHDDVQAALAS